MRTTARWSPSASVSLAVTSTVTGEPQRVVTLSSVATGAVLASDVTVTETVATAVSSPSEIS